jgi:hypothetical protein
VASIWRDPVVLIFVNEDNRELATLANPGVVPRVGENVRLAGVPHIVERVGYDVPDKKVIERIWVVLRPA